MNKEDIAIVLCGEAGQGIQTVEQLLVRILKLSGYNLFAAKEYMSRIRGGSNSTLVRVSSNRVSAWIDRIDILLPLDKEAIPHLGDRITEETIIIGEKAKLGADIPMIDVPFSEIAKKEGNIIYSNIVAVGLLAGLFKVDRKVIIAELESRFKNKGPEILDGNIKSADRGYRLGLEFAATSKIKVNVKANYQARDELVFNGTESVALGALAGGCNFISSYPMTPGTGVLTALAKYSKNFDIIVEQAEDEISAINMAIGAWYAGGRGMVTTSGGGFALMVEGISLAAMIETPVVIHLGQRPGPATGLPTRSEQADLEFALYAGHGEFPRIIFAPGSLEEAFYLSQKAFYLADKYQVPVIILTDQQLVDSYYNIPALDITALKNERFIVETKSDYRRYRLTDNGISPRGVPGFGEGLVSVDSDEHDEEGHITEDLKLRPKMVEKRLKKLDLIKQEIIPPELIGGDSYKILVVGWGSTLNVLKEALVKLKRKDMALLHFKQVYPFSGMVYQYLKEAQKTVIFENNATSQFAKLIGSEFDQHVLKYNGLPFSVEEVLEALDKI